MLYIKSCMRCSGDLYLDQDIYGSYLRCLQCGRLTEVKARPPGTVRTKRGTSKKLAA